MFEKKYRRDIDSFEVMDFVRILGRFGMKFTVSNERYIADDTYPNRRRSVRTFHIYTTRRQYRKFCEAIDILANYHLH